MIITFCGHSDFRESTDIRGKLLSLLTESVGDAPAEIYLGGYGNFDSFALNCCREYKRSHPNVTITYVTPYLNAAHEGYDAVLYPPIENKPKRFAISYRNKYMVEKADLVVAYVSRDWGGAYATYKHAIKKCKATVNLAE